MTLKIRPFEPTQTEYQTIATVLKEIEPEHSRTAEELQHSDETLGEGTICQRYVGELDNEIVAVSILVQSRPMQAVGKFWLNFDVHPAHFQESYIAQLHDHLLENVTKFNAKKVATNARENNPARIAFLEAHGYDCLMRECTSKLDVIQFDPTPFQAIVEKSQQARIAIYTLADLKRHDPDWLAKLEALHWQVGCDIPSVDPPDPNSRLSLDEYQKRFERPSHMPDGFFVAVDETAGTLAEGSYVGMSHFWRILDDPTRLDTGVTGVLRSHRRKGIATALKLHAIDFAKAYGAKTISTENEENNPMYQLNLTLGFQPQPAWLEYVKVL